MTKKKHLEPIPEEFTTYEEAGEFWDAHDTADYPDAFRTVEVVAELRRRRCEIEIDPDVARALRRRARQRGLSMSRLASDLLRQRLTNAK
jgi:hypothetical protein